MSEKIAERVKVSEASRGGIESWLDFFAKLTALAGFIYVLVILGMGDAPLKFRVINAFEAFLFAGIIFVSLLGLAEVIRLLKRMNGLPYGGSLSTVKKTSAYACGNCGARVYNDENSCDCGTTIKKDPTSSPEP